jgi:uncharacterized protein YjiS (DUF1127 family)
MTTVCLPLPHQISAASRTSRLARVAEWIAGFLRALKNRRDVEVLASLDDRMLSDMGLTRGDVRDAVSEPLWRDPSTILVMRSLEGRRGQIRRGDGKPILQAPGLVPEQVSEAVKWPNRLRAY